MGTIYVDKTRTGGADDGSSWTDAYLTVAQALAAANAGDDVYIAPGRYNESNLTPTNAGTYGTPPSWITYTGDYDGALGSGGTGYVIIDGSVSNYWNNVNTTVAYANNWTYHRFYNIYFTGSNKNNLGPATNQASQIQLYNCIFEGVESGLWYNNVKLDASNNPTLYASRCIFIGYGRGNASQSTCLYSSGVYCWNQDGNSHKAYPQFSFDNCFFYGGIACLDVHGSTGLPAYSWAEFDSCTFFRPHYSGANTTAAVMSHDSATSTATVKADFVNCLFSTQGITINTTLGKITLNSVTNCYVFSHAQYGAATQTAKPPLFPMLALLATDSDAIDNGATALTEDLFGTGRPITTDDVGCQEYKSTRYPKEPTMIPGTQDIPDIGNVTEDDTSDGSTGTYHEAAEAEVQSGVAFGAGSALTGTFVGEGGPATVSGVSRSRIVNAGGI